MLCYSSKASLHSFSCNGYSGWSFERATGRLQCRQRGVSRRRGRGRRRGMAAGGPGARGTLCGLMVSFKPLEQPILSSDLTVFIVGRGPTSGSCCWEKISIKENAAPLSLVAWPGATSLWGGVARLNPGWPRSDLVHLERTFSSAMSSDDEILSLATSPKHHLWYILSGGWKDYTFLNVDWYTLKQFGLDNHFKVFFTVWPLSRICVWSLNIVHNNKRIQSASR